MIKCAVFDADGTLIDSLGVWMSADEEYLKSKGRRLDPDTYRKFIKMTFAESIAYVKRHYGLDEPEEAISEEIKKIVMKKYENEIEVTNGIPGLLKRLLDNDVPMAVATSNDRKLICRALRSTGLRRYFTHIVTCDETGCGKDDAAVFVRAAEMLGCKPSETLVVEDDREYVKAARAAGFVAIHISEIGRLGYGE